MLFATEFGTIACVGLPYACIGLHAATPGRNHEAAWDSDRPRFAGDARDLLRR